jgi:glycosyltransferase involved in cell wall biosynthesis
MSPRPPRLSVLVPARDAAATLDEALDSLAAQTFGDWEAIVVDDGSTDATPDLLARRAQADPRFRVLRNPVGAGLVLSLNRALETARAPLLARMDADDISLPTRFARQVERISHGDAAAVGCRVRYFPEAQVLPGARRYETWLNSLTTPEEHDRDMFVECPLAHPSMLLRAEAVRAVGGYQARGWPEDYDLCLRLWQAGGALAKVPELLFLWREGRERTSRTHPDYRLEAFHRCKAHYLRRTHLAGGRPALVFGSGPVGKALARTLLREGAVLRGFVDLDPRKIGQRIYGAMVYSQAEGLTLREAFGLAAVGQPGAREELRATLKESGWRETIDFRCVA